MNRLKGRDRERLAAALVEGNSIRATSRLTGVAFNTVLKFVEDIGWACQIYLDEHMRDLTCRRIQCDEIWAFCYAKDKNVPEAMRNTRGIGSVWTWMALDADTKLKPAFHVGTRDAGCAYEFMVGLAKRLRGRVQLTTDGHKAYLEGVYAGFGLDVDYAMLVKLYGQEPAGEARYSPAKCIGTRIDVKCGEPDPDHVSTSFIERSNLTLRMASRRFTRLTNGFSRKVENLEHAVALHHMHYNFVRKHMTLGTTPAVAAGIESRPWTLTDLIAMLEAMERGQERRVAGN